MAVETRQYSWLIREDAAAVGRDYRNWDPFLEGFTSSHVPVGVHDRVVQLQREVRERYGESLEHPELEVTRHLFGPEVLPLLSSEVDTKYAVWYAAGRSTLRELVIVHTRVPDEQRTAAFAANDYGVFSSFVERGHTHKDRKRYLLGNGEAWDAGILSGLYRDEATTLLKVIESMNGETVLKHRAAEYLGYMTQVEHDAQNDPEQLARFQELRDFVEAFYAAA